MDAKNQIESKSNRQLRIALAVVALFSFGGASAAQAQSIQLVTDSRGPSAEHSLTTDIVALPTTRWQVANETLARGCMVIWTAQAFEHSSSPQAKANCEIAARLLDANRSARWRLEKANGVSSVENGNDEASVILSSRSTGYVEVELSVRYRDIPGQQPVAGSYSTTVTGTITGR